MPVYKSKKPTKDGRSWQFRLSTTESGKRKQYRSKLFHTKSEALEEEARFKLKSNLYEEKDKTIDELYFEYIEYKSSRVKYGTLYDLKKKQKYLEAIKNKKLKSIRLKDIEQLKNAMNQNWSVSHKNSIIKTLKAINNFSYQMYDIRNNHLDKIDYFRDNTIKKNVDFFTLDEFKLFIDKIEKINHKAFFTVLFFCGLRLGEALALTWNDYNKKELSITKSLSNKVVGVPFAITTPKNKGSVRRIPTPKQVIDILEEWYNEISKYEDFNHDWFIFRDFQPLKNTTITKVKNKACKEANIKQIRIHDFRHSTASLLINNGANINLVSEYLGHEDIKMTLNTYSHLYDSELKNIVERINNLEKGA